MPLLDLSQTTVAIQRLLELNIPLLAPTLGTLTVSTLPPERTQGGDHVLSIYCYHVSPDPANRFRPRQVGGPRPVATAPLTLILHYILTAHTFNNGSDFNALAEQRLLGYAMKTLHDYPVIDDRTRVDGQIVMPSEILGADNSFSITQLQLTASEALNYWANEGQAGVKPSCYYEVAAAELQADLPDRLPGIVLQLGSYVFPKSAPVLAQSQSQLPFTNPVSAGAGAVTLMASPARIGADVGPPPANVLRLPGRGLAGGDARRLLLSHPFWARHFPGGTAPLDLVLNSALGWAVTVADDLVAIEMGDVLRAEPPGGGAPIDLDLYPGIYTATWETARTIQRDGATQWLRERSNAAPVIVYPRILSSARDIVTGAVTLTLGGSWLLTRGRPMPADPTTAPELAVDLSIDGRAYRLVDTPAPGGPGTFAIADHALVYAPNPEEDTGGDHAIRLIVDGADSQPFWVAVP